MNKHHNLPTQCPSCGFQLSINRLVCEACSTVVQGDYSLPAFARLTAEEQLLCINFIKTGGSLKELARIYGISYPTIRNHIDTLIEKLKKMENEEQLNKTSQEGEHHE
jgi:hypothetical protein